MPSKRDLKTRARQVTDRVAGYDAPSPTYDDLIDDATDAQFLQFLEAQGGLGLDPLSDEGLSLQAQYVKQIGDHPLDVLKTLSCNPFVKPGDRITAAKALLEYGARKVPAAFELSGKGGTPLVLDVKALSKLSDADLAALDALLTKARGD